MSRSRRTLVVMLALTLILSVLSACSSGGSDSGKATQDSGTQGTNRNMQVSVSNFDRGQVPSAEGTYENNRWTKFINDKSGVTVKWVPVLRTQAQQKLNALIASGDAPDLMWEYDRNYIGQLKDQGVIQPIDDFINKYSTSYKNYLKAHPELLPYVTFDGKMYAATSARGIDKIANHAMWIRQDWLDKLGLKTPTTVEEFLDVLRAFRDKDPDGNGKKDTFGLAFNYNYESVIEALFAAHGGSWYIENGKITYGPLTDRYVDSLNMKKTLFEEGLIDKEYITDKNFQRERQLFVTGKAGVYIASWDVATEYADLKKNVPDANLVPLEPVASKYGKFGLYQEPPANRLVAFNKDIKDPEAAVKFLDWVIDKGWFPLQNGIEGTHYKMVNGVPQKLDADKFKNEVVYANEYAVIDQYLPKSEDFPIKAAQDPVSQEYAKKQTVSLDIQLKNKFRRDVPYNPSFPELSELLTSFGTTSGDIKIKVITGGSQYTAQWGEDQLRQEWKRLGGDKVDQLAQQWYEKNFKK